MLINFGIINFLFYQKVDLGIADLSINYEREKDDNGRGQQIHKIHTNNCMDL